MWEIEHYVSESGQRPIGDFFSDLNKATELPYVMRDISQLANLGNDARRPLASPLRDGVYELRTRINKKQFRILYFFFFNEKIILSHGFLKKSAEVPQTNIDLALLHKKDYFKRHKRKNES